MKAILCFVVFVALFGRPAVAADARAVIVVAVPVNADATIVEALHRLRGEATAVGFEVRLVPLPAEQMAPEHLARLRDDSHAAAVVTVAVPDEAAGLTRSLDVTFTTGPDPSGVSVAHIAAADVTDKERGEVILAVRAVDFIRARMFDTLVDRGVETRRAQIEHREEAVTSQPKQNRFHLAAGLVALTSAPDFGPSLSPRLGLGYLPWDWLRVRAVAFGLGSKPSRQSALGQVSLDPHFVGAELSLFSRRWWRLQPAVSLSAGDYWVDVRGEAKSADVVGQTVTRSSPAAGLSLGLALDLGHGLACELFVGTLLLQRRVRVATETEDLGNLGYALASGGLMVNADF